MNIYKAKNPKGLIIRLPWMSDSPFADEKNPLLQTFVKQAIENGITVIVLASPGTAWIWYIEQRTMKLLEQSLMSSLQIIQRQMVWYNKIKKYLVWRSVWWTLVGASLGIKDFDKFIIVAWRLDTQELYNEVMNKPDEHPVVSMSWKIFYGFGWLQEHIQAWVIATANGQRLYCQTEEYVQELLTKKQAIESTFVEVSKRSRKPDLLIVQAKDDTKVPYTQLNRRVQLAQNNNIPVTSVTIEYECWHDFRHKEAVDETVHAILAFIQK